MAQSRSELKAAPHPAAPPIAMRPGLTRGPRGVLLVLVTGLGPQAAAEKHPVPFGDAAGRPQPLLQTLDRPPGPTSACLLGRLPRPGGAAMTQRARERQEQQGQQEPEWAPHGRAHSPNPPPGFTRLRPAPSAGPASVAASAARVGRGLALPREPQPDVTEARRHPSETETQAVRRASRGRAQAPPTRPTAAYSGVIVGVRS